jgi:BirA family transcriptional regulator, biotin operon repressor / biotin---[acetyl-CoA-carboxylase] ligase
MGAFRYPHRHYRRTDSTNARARELAAAGAPGGTIVTADEQTAGRGRQGRIWTAPAGKALLYSAIVRPFDERHGLLPLAVPIAVSEAAESLAPADASCQLKWPNDVWLEGRKLAGVLIESRAGDGWAVIGIGVNVAIEPHEFPPELRDRAVSIGGDATVGAALAAVNESLAAWIEVEPARILDEFRRRDALRGRSVSWDGGSGVAVGVDDVGHLLVDVGSGTVALGAGEVHLTVG